MAYYHSDRSYTKVPDQLVARYRSYTLILVRIYFPIPGSVTGSLPIIRVVENETAVIQIPAADWDIQDDVRCRWANKTGPAGDECGDICRNMPGATISLRFLCSLVLSSFYSHSSVESLPLEIVLLHGTL